MFEIRNLAKRLIADRLIDRAQRSAPDFVVHNDAGVYLRRWWILPRNPVFNLYLHQIVSSDDDKALHCHPWFNLSLILRGSYIERLPRHQNQVSGFDYVRGFYRDVPRPAGSLVFRLGHHRHRLILPANGECWTLFVTGPVYRRWGFHCRQGWVYWRKFVSARDKGRVGAGCG